MKKYYLIQEYCDFGFWDEGTKTFRGVLYATKYESDPSTEELGQLHVASSKKPCQIVTIFYPE